MGSDISNHLGTRRQAGATDHWVSLQERSSFSGGATRSTGNCL